VTDSLSIIGCNIRQKKGEKQTFASKNRNSFFEYRRDIESRINKHILINLSYGFVHGKSTCSQKHSVSNDKE